VVSIAQEPLLDIRIRHGVRDASVRHVVRFHSIGRDVCCRICIEPIAPRQSREVVDADTLRPGIAHEIVQCRVGRRDLPSNDDHLSVAGDIARMSRTGKFRLAAVHLPIERWEGERPDCSQSYGAIEVKFGVQATMEKDLCTSLAEKVVGSVAMSCTDFISAVVPFNTHDAGVGDGRRWSTADLLFPPLLRYRLE